MRDFKKTKGPDKKTFGNRARFAARKGLFSKNSKPSEYQGEKYEAVCNECDKTCEVPFRPNGKKPVYCRDCFKKREGSVYHDSKSSNFRNENVGGNDLLKRQFTILSTKLDKLINVIETQNRLMSASTKVD